MANTSYHPAAAEGFFVRNLNRIKRLRYGRQMRAVGHRLGLPNFILDPLIKIVKVALYPGQFVARRWMAFKLLNAHATPLRVPRDTGCTLFGTDTFPDTAVVVQSCQEIYAEAKQRIDLSDERSFFRHNLLTLEELVGRPEILQWAVSPAVVGMAADYLGTIPIIAQLQLWWTPVNDRLEGSQYFHIDQIDPRHLKIALLIKDMTPEDGPLAFLPANITNRVKPNLSPKTRYDRVTDEEMFQFCKESDVLYAVGKPGEGGVADLSRCYHYGGRSRKGERLFLVVQFVSYHSVKETYDASWQRDCETLQNIPKEAWQRALLDLPPNMKSA